MMKFNAIAKLITRFCSYLCRQRALNDEQNFRHAALESLEERRVMATLTYTVDNPAVYAAANPAGLQDGKIDLTLRVANVSGTPTLQLVDVDKAFGGQVVASAPFVTNDPLIVNVTGFSTSIDGHTEEFAEALNIDLANTTGLVIPVVPLTVNMNGIKGTVVGLIQDDSLTINPSSNTLYSPASLSVTLSDGEALSVLGPVTAAGKVTLNGVESDIKVASTGSIAGGDIVLNATAVLNVQGDADSADALAMLAPTITISSGKLIGNNISVTSAATGNVTISSTTLRDGQFNVGGVVAISNSTIIVDGNSQITALGEILLWATSNITTLVTRGAQDDGNSNDDDRQEDAALAASVVTNAAALRISDTSTLTAGGNADFKASNIVNVTTIADGSLQNGNSGGNQAGGTLATATVVGDTEVLIEDAVTIAAVGNLTIDSSSARTVVTTSKSTPKGATDDGNSATKTRGQKALASNKASTADGDMTLAAAIAVSTVMGETRALVTGGSLSSSQGNIVIHSSADHDVQTLADGTVSTGQNGTGVGVAVAIGLMGVADATGASGLRSTTRVSGNVSLSAANISQEAFASQDTFTTQAISGPSGPSKDANGNNTGSDIGVAGALAIGLAITNTTADLAPTANVTAQGANFTLKANSNVINTVQALPKDDPVSGSSLGLGAGVAVNIVDNVTRSRVDNGAALTGVKDLNVLATSVGSTNTLGKAGAAGGTAIAAAVAFELAHNDTQAIIGTGNALINTGQTVVTAVHGGSLSANAEGDAEGGADAAIGAAVAIGLREDKTEAQVNRSLTSGKSITVSAINSTNTTSNAKASAQGESDSGQSDDANAQSANQRSAADSQATSRGARNSSDATTNPDASTSEGSITVAAAIALNLTRSHTRALLADGITVTADGPLSVKSFHETDASATADGSATKTQNGVGAAVAINAATADHHAIIGTGTKVFADGVSVDAVMPGNAVSQFSASSTSGAGASDVGVAGSLAINMARVDTLATIRPGATVTLVDGSDAGASVGDLHIEAGSSTTNTGTAAAKATGDTGVGASIVFNISDHDTRATIADTAVVSGANNILLDAHSQHPLTSTATGGATGGTAITPVAAATLGFQDTEARIGTLNGSLSATGNVSINTSHQGNVVSNATGKTSGSDAAIGASLAFTYVKENVNAKLDRNLTSGGGVSVTSSIEAAHPAQATASASGAKGEKDNQGGTAQEKNDKLRKSGNAKSQGFSGADSGEDNKATASTANKNGDKDGDAVTVAAAIAVNIVESHSTATVGDGLTVSSDGLLKVSSRQNVDASSLADGSASDGDVGIGAAVAINVVTITNQATIGASTIIADGVAVEALMTSPVAGQSDTSSFVAQAKSGAGGKDVGVAGSLSINHIELNATANLKNGAQVSLVDGNDLLNVAGPLSIKAQADTNNSSKALPNVPGGGASGDVGVGASVALNILYLDTSATIEDGVVFNGSASNINVEAIGTHDTTTTASNGAKGGDVGIGGAVAVAISKSHTRASVGFDQTTLTTSGNATVHSLHTNMLHTDVSSAATGGDAAIGASVGVVLVEDTASAELLRSIHATQSVSVQSQTETQSLLNVKASAGGGDSDGNDSDTEATNQANQPNAAGSDSNTVPSASDNTDSANSKSESESSESGGSVGIAASVAINALSIKNTARIGSGVTVTADTGSVTVSAPAHVISRTEADSTAVDLSGDVSIGAAVALNWVSLTNEARVGTGCQVTGVSVTVEAVTTDNNTNDYMATAYAVAGNTGDAAVAGVVALNIVDADTSAIVSDGAHIDASDDVMIKAEHHLRAQAAAIAGAVSGDAALAAAVAINVIGLNEQSEKGGSNTIASIGDPSSPSGAASVTSGGKVSVIADHSIGMFPILNLPDSLNHPSDPDYAIDDINEPVLSIGISGGGSTGSFAAAGSVSLNLFESTTHAGIDAATTVKGNSLVIAADDVTEINSLAGAVGAAADGAGLGLGLDLNILHKDTQATIGKQAKASTKNDAALSALSTETLTSIAATAGLGNSIGGAGSAVVQVIETTTRAAVEDGLTATEGAAVTANGLTLNSQGILTTRLVSGALGVGGNAGLGATNTTLVHNDDVSARVGNYAQVISTGTMTVSAQSQEDVVTLAAAVGAAGSVGVAGSASVNVLNETTKATIGDGASLDVGNGATVGTPNLIVAAGDTTNLVSVGGSLAASGSGAAGIGADVGTLNKTTQASVGSGVLANIEGNLLVKADSVEDVTSVAAGIAASGSVAVTLDASVHVANINTRAFIGDDYQDVVPSLGGGNIHALGSVVVAADDNSQLDKIVGVVAASGTAGVAGGAAVSTITKNTEAFVGEGANVSGDGNNTAVDARTGKYVVAYGAALKTTPGIESNTTSTRTATASKLRDSGEIGLPSLGSTDTNQDNKDDASSDPSLAGQRTLALEFVPGFRGVSISATNRDDIENYTMSLSAAGTAAVAVSAGVNVLNLNTRAFVGKDARLNQNLQNVNSLQGVLVTAGNDLSHVAFAGAVAAAGTAGVGPAADVTILNGTTEALLGWDAKNALSAKATVNAKDNVQVRANSNEDLLLVGVGVGVGGTVGIGAGIDVLVFNNHTRAIIGADANVKAEGNVVVLANDDSDIDVVSGGGGGGIVGAGGAVGVLNINKDTIAQIDANAYVDALGKSGDILGTLTGELNNDATDLAIGKARGIVVQATAHEDILHLAIAVGAGYVGVAGGVTVTMIDSDTQAEIADGAQINQQNIGLPNPNQSVVVNAGNVVHVVTFAGAVGGGLGAVAGAVDFGTVKNDTLARIGNAAKVKAALDVDVHSVGLKNMDDFTVSGSGGLVALSGAVSIWSIGSPLRQTYANESGKQANAAQGDDAAANNKADEDAAAQSQKSRDYLTGQLQTFKADPSANSKSNSARTSQITSAAALQLTSSAPSKLSLLDALKGNQASAGTTAIIGDFAEVTAGNNISATALEKVDVEVTVGGVSIGLGGIGASVSVLSTATNASAYSNGVLSAGDAILVQAKLDQDIKPSSFVGAGGFVGLGAAVVDISDSSTVQAAIGSVTNALTVTVLADADQVIALTTDQFNVGGAAAGASFTTLSATGAVGATVLGGAQIGQQAGQLVGTLSVKANSHIDAHNKTTAIAAGAVAVSANFARATIAPQVTATIGAGAEIKVDGSAKIESVATHESLTEVLSLTGGAVSVGASIATAELNTTVTTNVANAAHINAGSITLDSRFNHNGLSPNGMQAKAVAQAPSPVPGLAAGTGTNATAKANAKVLTSTGDASQLTSTSGNVMVRAVGSHDAEADGLALSLGLAAAVGITVVDATADGSTRVDVKGGIASAADLNVFARAVNKADADGEAASAAGFGGAAGVNTHAQASPTVEARVETDKFTNATGTFNLRSNANNQAHATGDGNAFAVAGLGQINTTATTSGKTSSYLKSTGDVHTLNMEADGTNTPTAHGTSAAGGVGASGSAVTATVNDLPQVMTILEGKVRVTDNVELLAKSTNTPTATANTISLSAGFADGGGAASIISKPIVQALAQGASITAPGALTMNALDTSSVNSSAGAASGGLGAAIGAGSATNVVAADVRAGVIHGLHSANAVTINAIETGVISAEADGKVIGGVSSVGGITTNDVKNKVKAQISNDVQFNALTPATGDFSISAQDTSTITSSVDQAAAGLGASGAAKSYVIAKNAVDATVDNLAFINTKGSVQVKGDENVTIHNTAVGLSAGLGAGVTGNVTVNTLANQTTTQIANNSSVTAGNNVIVSANMLDQLGSSTRSASGGAFGEGGTSMINTFDNVTVARVDNNSQVRADGVGASLAIQKWDSQGNSFTSQLDGLAVIANTQEVPLADPDGNGPIHPSQSLAYNVAGGVSGSASINAINIVNDRTDAFIASSQINSVAKAGDDVLVQAHTDSPFHTVADGVAGGAVGSGGVSTRTTMTNVTRAFISDVDESGDQTQQAAAVYGKNMEISAVSRESIELDTNGVTGGGFALAGAISIAELANKTQSFTRDSTVNSSGDLTITADDLAKVNGQIKTTSVGGVAGGASIGFTTIKNTTQAQVIGGELFADEALDVKARSHKTIETQLLAQGAGLAALAGTVALNVIESTTEANVLKGDQGAAINQAIPPMTDLVMLQTVSITANDDAKITNQQGSTAGGLAGVGASVDFGSIRNRTVATVGPEANINSTGDFTLDAHSSRELGSTVQSFAGGLAGLTGAVSFLTLGAPSAGDVTQSMQEFLKQDSSGNSLEQQTNKPSETSDVSSRIQGVTGTPSATIAADAAARVDALSDAQVKNTITATSGDRVTAALVIDAPTAAKRSRIQAEGNATIQGHNEYAIKQDIGSIAGGLVAIGASVAVTKVHNVTQAELGDNNVLAAGGDITINADDVHAPAGKIDMSILGGKAGAIAFDFNIAELTVDSQTSSAVGKHANIERAGKVLVTTTQTANIDIDGEGFSGAGLAGAGSVKVLPTITPTTSSLIDDDAQVGSVRMVGALRVGSISGTSVDDDVFVGAAAVAAGISSGQADVVINPSISSRIGDADVNVRGNTFVDTTGVFTADAHIDTVAAGTFADGSGLAHVDMTGSVTSRIDNGATLQTGALFVKADQANTSTTQGKAIGGGLVAGLATEASNEIEIDTKGSIGQANITSDGAVSVLVNGSSNATATSGTIGIVGIGKGGSVAEAKVIGAVTGEIDGGTIYAGKNIQLLTDSSNIANATAQATAAGIVNGNAAKTSAKTDVDTLSLVTSGNLTANDEIRVESSSKSTTDTNSIGAAASLLAAVGHVESKSNVEGSTRSMADGMFVSQTGYVRVQALDQDSHAISTAKAAGAGVGASISQTEAEATILPSADDTAAQVRARLGGKVTAAGDIAVRAKSIGASTEANAKGTDFGGAFTSTGTKSTSTLGQTVRSSIGDGADVHGDADIKVEALSQPAAAKAYASATGGSLLAGISGSSANAKNQGTVASVIGNAVVTAPQGTVLVNADTIRDVRATGDGIAIGLLVGVGNVTADARADGADDSTTASINDAAAVTAHNLTMQSTETSTGLSYVVGTGGGFVSGQGTKAVTSMQPHVNVNVGSEANVHLTGDATLLAQAVVEGDSEAEGNSFGAVAAVSESSGQVFLTPTVTTSLGKDSHIDADNNITITSAINPNAPTDIAPTLGPKNGNSQGKVSLIQGDGYSQARSIGAAGSAFVGVQGTVAKVSATPTATIQFTTPSSNQPPTLQAGNDLTVRTRSRSNVDTQTTNKAVGVLAVGDGNALSGSTINSTSKIDVAPSVQLQADHDLMLDAAARHVANGDASAEGFGVIGHANADSYSDINYGTDAIVEAGAKLTAGNALTVSATTNSLGDADADAKGGGVGASTNANDSAEDNASGVDDKAIGTARRGVRIGHDVGLTRADVRENAELQAKSVSLLATIDRTEGSASSSADSEGAEADAFALARVELWDDASVNVRSGAKVTGTDQILLQAKVDEIDINYFISARSAGLFVDAGVTGIVDSDNDALVNAEDTALFTTHDLQVKTLANNVDYPTPDPSKSNMKGSLGAARSITFDADAVLTSGPAVLVIGPNGTPLDQQNVDYHVSGTTIVVHDIVNDHPGSVLFQTNTVVDAPPGQVISVGVLQTLLGNGQITHGIGPQFIFKETLDNVTIENQSALSMSIGNVGVVNKSVKPEVAIDTQRISLPLGLNPNNLTEVFGFDVKHTFDETSVSILDSNATTPGNVVINGQIDNPIGHTVISNANGRVQRGANTSALIRTNELEIVATSLIGTSAAPLDIELVQSALRPVDLTVSTPGDVNLTVRGLMRDSNVNQFTFNGGNITGNSISIGLSDAFLQKTLDPGVSYLVDVSETHPVQVTPVENRFRPIPNLASLTVLDLGIFGVGGQPIDSAYQFDLLQSVGDINVQSLNVASKISLNALSDITGSGKINVDLNSNIQVKEYVGDLRVGLIVSQTGDVILATNLGSIIDADNEALSDVTGRSIQLQAQVGGIGAQGNPLDINSSVGQVGAAQDGKVNASSVGGIYLVETLGVLNSGLIKSSLGDVSLTALSGAIVDVLNENLINISGNNIMLLAIGGATSTLGEVGDRLEVCTSGLADWTADGSQYVLNVCGLLKIKLIQSNLASVDIASLGSVSIDNGLVSAFADVSLNSNLDMLLSSTSHIAAGSDVSLFAGQALTEGNVGALVRSEGQIDARQLNVFGSDAHDTFVMKHHAPRGPMHLKAGRGNDTIDVAAITDEVFADGQAGDDLFLTDDLNLKHLAGNVGNDQLQVKSSGISLNLTRMEGDTLTGVEMVDIGGTGRNSVSLDQLSVLHLSDETHTLIVRRQRDDLVDIGSGWTFRGNEIIGQQLFKVYEQSGATVKVQSISALVLGRNLFYNGSFFDGNAAGPTTGDDAAIASDKVALISGTATLANVSSYSKGINGIMIDVFNVPEDAKLTAEDFAFRVGNTDTTATWGEAPRPTSITLRPGAGTLGSLRIVMIWPDNVIQQQWLQVTVLPTANTTLETADVFYFGNAIGDVGNSPSNVIVNATDVATVVSNQNSFLNPARITSPYDFNHDRLINATDVAIAVSHQTSFLNALRLIRLTSTQKVAVGGEVIALPAPPVGPVLLSNGNLQRISQSDMPLTDDVGQLQTRIANSVEQYNQRIDQLFAANFDAWSEAAESVLADSLPSHVTLLSPKSNVKG